ncbi:MAG: ABC transporter permease [Clostridia bacterium]
MEKKWLRALAIFLWLLAWHVASRIVNQSLFLPGPLDTLRALAGLLGSRDFFSTVGISAWRILSAFFISTILGILIGVPSALSRRFEILVEPFITVMKSTPVMSFILIFILWFRLGMVPVMVGIFMCFPVIYKNVVEGVRDIDPRLLELSRIYKVKKKDVFTGIVLGSIKPYLYASMNVSLGLAFRVIVAAEVLANPRYGIGSRLYGAKVYFETEEMFAWTFAIIALSYVFELVLKYTMSGKKRKGKAKCRL